MKNNVILSSILIGFLATSTGVVFAMEDEEAEKIKQLQQYMKPRKTRAIVYDDPKKDDTSEKSSKIEDCTKLPEDAETMEIDFSIQFKTGRSDIAPSSEYTLQEIAKVLKLTPDRCIFVEGHTDAIGNANANMALSKDRAESVVNFIVGKVKMDKSRFTATGKGSTEPLKNLDPRDAKNRRVVFKVVG